MVGQAQNNSYRNAHSKRWKRGDTDPKSFGNSAEQLPLGSRSGSSPLGLEVPSSGPWLRHQGLGSIIFERK